MTTTTTAPTGPATAERSGLSFGGVLRSEAIKLTTLRSTVWCFAIIVLVTVGLAFLLAATFFTPAPLPDDGVQAVWVQVGTLGITFSQLVVAVLGALVITGEYSTGMIRSTLTAVPRRIPALAAKAIVIGVATFVVGLVSVLAAAFLPAGILAGNGAEPDFADPAAYAAFAGGALYLALIAVLSLSIGTIVRNSAGGIAASLGLLLVVPGVLSLIAAITSTEWLQNLSQFLPSALGNVLYAYPQDTGPVPDGIVALEPWQAALWLFAWVAVAFATAAVLIKRRDA
ncbi:ABC transporter permease subunit [Marisediminicola senii]|uniref:ABC transporter permease subunit n=1 Tax=Marisediminicola senii TaxID=2711233 RepID=UPI0013EC6426|nr:ABC transporter permease subunit [Marisediminicola senii]